jgi:hypothetical protein
MLDALDAVLLVDQPKNTLSLFVMLVVLFESVALHVGNDIVEPVVQVNVVVCEDAVTATFFILPAPPLLLNVIVFVFAEQDGVNVLLPLAIEYPVSQLVV